ncbi:MAG TPA: M12 family metallo-peptidase [Saprospiraceae bacterium]|nr:M12 family metallo-peptidase [Saprospiraceae bacterium]
MSTQRFLVPLIFLVSGLSLDAQTPDTDLRPIARQLMINKELHSLAHLNLFEQDLDSEISSAIRDFVRKAEFFHLKPDAISPIHDIRPELLQLPIPRLDETIVLELYRVEIFSGSYSLRTSDGQSFPRKENMIFYRGIVSGDPNSVATMSVLDAEVRILFSTAKGNYRIHKAHNEQYILFMDRDVYQKESYTCSVPEEDLTYNEEDKGNQQRSMLTGNCVEVYFECDYETYQDNGSSESNTEAWVAAIFNEVATIYDNEDIPIYISDIMVWTTTDPYAGLNSTSAVLNEFVNQTEENGYTGRLAHLLSTRSLGGGVAYVDVLCSATLACAVSASLSTNVVLFPNYSWNVNVISHEMGHNFGSSHTHNCVWNGNSTQIDDCGSVYGNVQPCYDEENPILPEDGTIMSYCHLVGGVGINFSLGFGPQPGNRLRSEYQNAPCNTGTCTPPSCTVLSMPLCFSTQVDVGTNISWEAVMGADGYRITIGTSAGLGDIVDTLDVGQVTTYNPSSDLEFNTTIYVRIIAYNNMGDAIECEDEYFTTEDDVIPECTLLTSPLNGATDVLTGADLFWTHSVGNQEGYRLTVGTTPEGGEIADLFDVGNVTTYNPGPLLGSSTIYVSIFPYWAGGDITGCIEESFTTADPVYCASNGTNVDHEWISAVSFGPLSNPSGALVYSDFTNLTADVSAGVSYPVSITAGYSGQAFNEYFRVWIDSNHDGIFQNPGERVFQSGPATGTVSGNILMPVTAYIGVTRMRVSMRYSAFSNPCQVFAFGEVEDYSVNIQCNKVTNTLDQGPGSLSWAVGCVSSGDTITFASTLNGETIFLENAHVTLDAPVSIVANPLSDISVYGLSTTRVFEINEGVSVSISGLNIIAGTAIEGNAIQNSGTLLLTDITIFQHPGINGSMLIMNEGSLALGGACKVY